MLSLAAAAAEQAEAEAEAEARSGVRVGRQAGQTVGRQRAASRISSRADVDCKTKACVSGHMQHRATVCGLVVSVKVDVCVGSKGFGLFACGSG